MNAVAISNNDMVYLHWYFEAKIPHCLGFTVIRHDTKTERQQALPAMVGFRQEDTSEGKKAASQRFRNTNVWPVQKFAWKDLFAERGGTYWYEIIPMIGEPGDLKPDIAKAMRTNAVSLDSKRGNCSIFFNRGIISTQAVARSLPKGRSGFPSTGVLKQRIAKPNDPLRARLMGDLEKGVLSLIERTQEDGGQCYCALYELHDQDLIDHLAALGKKVHIILSNAGEDTEEGSSDGDSTNSDARRLLHKNKQDVTDRMLQKGYIGHNKFVVYVDRTGPQAVLTGSTNWTSSGLCAQSNNAILIESPDLAKEYRKYWDELLQDTKSADGDSAKLQAKGFRADNKEERHGHDLKDNNGTADGAVRVWFSPNTPQKRVPRDRKKTKKGQIAKLPPTPADLDEVFKAIENAKQGALFLAFIPGSPSIVTKLKEVYDVRAAEGKLFYLRGAATSSDPATEFRVDLYHRSSKSDASIRAVTEPARTANASVSSVAGVFMRFAQWEAEIYKAGHAVIHDKILVIDPFTDDSVVVTGSHNLGFKASYSNDENMLIIRNNRSVAEAYAAHVLDVYEHYRWRWRLQAPIRDAFQKLKSRKPKAKAAELWKQAVEQVGPTVIKKAWQFLSPTDGWQDFYIKNKDFLAAETNFWSPFAGVGLASGRPRDPARRRG
jgi:phosphatidylserine/phosphatidylglycerophosphate/cardiolipin synthase-like enzyme